MELLLTCPIEGTQGPGQDGQGMFGESIKQRVETDSQIKASTWLVLRPFCFARGHCSDHADVNRYSCRKTAAEERWMALQCVLNRKHKNVLLFFNGGTI